jgi:glycosyltransferase involved in cell wall biosynthesis
LAHYGANREKIYEYPFSSIQEKDIVTQRISSEEKRNLRQKLDISEEKVLISVGQFIHRKGFDVLLKSAAKLEDDIGIYIVGGKPTEEYLKLRSDLGLSNVHFVGFMKKEKLAHVYRAADLFVLPTREDIWGLVINEAMAYGLPVITTDRCVAGLELVEDGVNGYIIPVEDEKALAEKIEACFASDYHAMGEKSLEKVRPYTIENMVRAHLKIFEEN